MHVDTTSSCIWSKSLRQRANDNIIVTAVLLALSHKCAVMFNVLIKLAVYYCVCVSPTNNHIHDITFIHHRRIITYI